MRKTITLIAILVLAFGICCIGNAALAEERALKTDNVMYQFALSPDPDYEWEYLYDYHTFTLDAPAKLDLEIWRFGRYMWVDIERKDSGDRYDGYRLYWNEEDYLLPLKQKHSAYLPAGEYQIVVGGDRDKYALDYRYGIKASLSPFTRPLTATVGSSYDDNMYDIPAESLSSAKPVNDIVFAHFQNVNGYKFTLADNSNVAFKFDGIKYYAGVSLFKLVGDDPTVIYISPEATSKAQKINTTFYLESGTYFIVLHNRNYYEDEDGPWWSDGDQDIPFKMSLKATAFAAPKVSLPKNASVVLGASPLRLSPFGDTNTDYVVSGMVWESSKPEIATVENGVVTNLSVGTTKITCTYLNKTYTTSLKVLPNQYNLSKPLTGSGKYVFMSVNKLEHTTDGNIKVTLFVNNKTGKPLAGISVSWAEVLLWGHRTNYSWRTFSGEEEPGTECDKVFEFSTPLKHNKYTTITMTLYTDLAPGTPSNTVFDLTKGGTYLDCNYRAFTDIVAKKLGVSAPKIKFLNKGDKGAKFDTKSTKQTSIKVSVK